MTPTHQTSDLHGFFRRLNELGVNHRQAVSLLLNWAALEDSNMNIESFIDTLSAEQQQAAFDLLWQRLSADPHNLASPAWHREVLAYRTANPSDKPKMSISDAKMEVKRMVDERRSSR